MKRRQLEIRWLTNPILTLVLLFTVWFIISLILFRVVEKYDEKQ
jgi:hypothetical protein